MPSSHCVLNAESRCFPRCHTTSSEILPGQDPGQFLAAGNISCCCPCCTGLSGRQDAGNGGTVSQSRDETTVLLIDGIPDWSSLDNNLSNLGIFDLCGHVLQDMGLVLEDILGNETMRR